MAVNSLDALIERLALAPHPEGGFFRETFRSPAFITTASLAGPRAASTAIYFVLPADAFSAWHRVRSDEVWHHYDGAPLELHTIDPIGAHTAILLGRDLARGERPQYVVPAGWFQAARPLAPAQGAADYALCGCTVAPGFDFADFDLPSRAELQRRFPQHSAIIDALTRI